MKNHPLLALCFLATAIAYGQSYTVGVQSVTWTDASRSNRSVPVEFHYPGTNTSIAADSFGFVVFGHGFDMTIDAYYNYADSLATHGYIVALTSNEGGLSPNHTNLAQDLIYIYNTMISQSNSNAASLLFHHVKSKGAIAGHSMGGGCTVLSCQYSDTATCYWTLAEATTTPSSITAAPFMRKPYLSFAGSSDCIAPATTNQIPTYDSSGSVCKTFIEIKNATHCQFANSNVACNFGEGVSGCAATTLSRAAQTDEVLSFLYPYLDYYLNGNCSAWTSFEGLYNGDVADALMQSCNNVVPASQMVTGNPSFCHADSDLLSATPTGFTYLWNTGATGAAIEVSNPGNYSFTVSNGVCSLATAQFAVAEKFTPAAPSAVTAPDTVCSGIANINISVVNDTNATNYNWTLPNGWNITTGGGTAVIQATSGNNGGNITVRAQNACGTSTPVQKAIVVTPSNLGTAGIITGDTLMCAGQNLLYFIAPVTGTASYVWNYPSGWLMVSGGNTDSISLTANTTSGTIQVQAQNSCGLSAPASLNVNVRPLPAIGTITGTDSVCTNNNSPLDFILSNVSGYDTLVWSIPGTWNIISGSGTRNISVYCNQSGGSVSVSASNACGTADTGPYNVAMVDTPQTTIAKNGDTLMAGAGSSYQWYLNGVQLSGATSQNYIASQTGAYTVAVTNGANCTGTSSAYSFVYLSFNGIQGKEPVTLFPNPAAGQFRVIISNEMLGCELNIFDALGRKVFEKKLVEANSFIEPGSLSKGVYLIYIVSGVAGVTKKLIIE